MSVSPSVLFSAAAILALGSQASAEDLTAEQDHARLMSLLKIEALRPGADPRNPEAQNAPNYDEGKAGQPGLPDPLVLRSGRKVTTADEWWKARRAEIVEDFDREVYGRVPQGLPRVTWEVTSTTKESVGGHAVTTKAIRGHVDNTRDPAVTVDIELTLTTPDAAPSRVPVMIEFGFRFPPGMAHPLNPPKPPRPTWQEQLISRGWGYAVLYPTTVQEDSGAGLARGIIGLANKGRPRGLDQWGALRAWAWGASRALDYLETDPAVDSKSVGIEGLSRYGKAALVTMAYDARFAVAFVASSGAGGAKLLRRDFGERVENVASPAEYHWMAGNFLKYAGPLHPSDLPVDAHELIALCAPRPVFISAGSFESEGGWVDQKGTFLAAVAAGSVYGLLGRKGLGREDFPPIETPVLNGDLAFRQHKDGHTAGPNWPFFLGWVEGFLKPAGGRPKRIALTFDDLPAHASLPPGVTRVDVARSVITALEEHKAPATYGFVNAKGLEEGPDDEEVLRLWRAAGYPLANHTFSHIDLNANSVQAFEDDLVKGEVVLERLMGQDDWHWLRFPYLHEGDTLEKRREIRAYLQKQGYRIAEVTMSFDDYAYNDTYARCVAKGDKGSIEEMRGSYLSRAKDSLDLGQASSRRVLGRDIPHVMLLHIGAFQMEMLGKLLDLIEGEGFTLVTLEEAEADSAYATDPDIVSSAMLVEQLATKEGIPLEGLRKDEVYAHLQTLCR